MNKATSLRKTKIIATIGPACDSVEILKEMIKAGLNVARLNLSHGTYEEHQERIDRIRSAAKKTGYPVAVMVDNRGIEVRTKKVQGGSAKLVTKSEFILYADDRMGDKDGVAITYKNLYKDVSPKTHICLDDGSIDLKVVSVVGSDIICKVTHGSTLGDHKSVNLPETELSFGSVSTHASKEEINFAADNDVDYFAASFVQSAEDVFAIREAFKSRERKIPIIAKIENKAGIKNLEEIVNAADGVMVARGDLGVELPLADVPVSQKKIIHTTVMNGKPVITATEMLASMERNPKPTRAEASDVANAILDGTSAVMLSGETAIGKYPVEAVKMMSTIAVRAEESLLEYGFLQKIHMNPKNIIPEVVSRSAVEMASKLNAVAILSLTETGFTSRLVSKNRPACPILAITSSKLVTRRLAMNWGVVPLRYKESNNDDSKLRFAINKAKSLGFINPGEVIVVTQGYSQRAGGTDLIRVMVVEK